MSEHIITCDDEVANELLPCPFCGGKAEIDRYTIKPYVSCTRCGCSMPDRHQTVEQAIEAWNTRMPVKS